MLDRFGQYDYGASMNWKKYNSTNPPDYDLKSINVPITLIYGKNDLIADVKVSFFECMWKSFRLKTVELFFHVDTLAGRDET